MSDASFGSTAVNLPRSLIARSSRASRPHLPGGGPVAEIGQVTREEIDRFYVLIEDPSFSVNSYTLVSARGRRPGAD